MFFKLNIQLIVLSCFFSTYISAIEYIGIDKLQNGVASENIIQADKGFKLFFRGEVNLDELLSMIRKVKDKRYKQHFLFYYRISSEQHEYSDEELSLILIDALMITKVAIGLYYESQGKIVQAVNVLDSLKEKIAKIYKARVMITGNVGVEDGVKTLAMLAKEGNEQAASILGAYYSEQRRYKLANKYLISVENKNFPFALHNLALNYYYGRGVAKDLDKAKLLFERSSNLAQLTESDYMLGIIYLSRGKDRKAEKSFMKAAKRGHSKSEYELGKYFLSRVKDNASMIKANEYLMAAVKNDVLPAYYHLAKMRVVQFNVLHDEIYLQEAYSLAKEAFKLDETIGRETLKMIEEHKQR